MKAKCSGHIFIGNSIIKCQFNLMKLITNISDTGNLKGV